MATIIGVAVALMAAFVVWRIVATIRGSRRQFEDVYQQVAPLAERLQAGYNPDIGQVRRLAANPATRNLLWDAMASSKRTGLFPAEFRTPEAIAESDFVYWLRHPNELGSSPDEIQLVSRFTRQAPGHGDVIYFLFRFRVNEPHWAAKNGWMAGVAGAYQESGGELKHALPGTFSQCNSYEAKSPDAHVDYYHELAIRKSSD